MKKEERKESLERLKKLLKYTNKTLIFGDLKASQSGMSRTFRVYIVKNKELLNVTT